MPVTRSRPVSAVALALVALLALAGCGDDDDAETAAGDEATTDTGADDPIEGPTEFCSAVSELNVQTPQAFTGSGEQLDALEDMAASAPDDVAADVETWLDWAREQVDQTTAEDTVEEFPPDVEDAIFNVSAYEDEHCG